MRRKNRGKKPLLDNQTKCIVILSSGEINSIDKAIEAENRQLNRINEFAKNNNLLPMKIIRRGIMGRGIFNRYFMGAVDYIKIGKVQAVVAVNLDTISYGLADAYYKVGLVREAGGRLFTVDEKEPVLYIYNPPKRKDVEKYEN